jgi:hypothetical protein
MKKKPKLFALGRVVVTPGAAALDPEGLARSLIRHMEGDWGKVCEEDKALNDEALKDGSRVLSSYDIGGTTLWIITEADRSVTTFLLPEEY